MVDIKAFNKFCVEQICSSCPYYRKDSECWAEWAYQQGRADAIDEFKMLIKTRLIDNLSLEGAKKYGNKDAVQQANSYSTIMKYEIADCINDLLDDLEQLKEQKNETT